MSVSPPEPCACRLPWGERVTEAVARHLGQPLASTADMRCAEAHEFAKTLGGAAYVAQVDRRLVGETLGYLPPPESTAPSGSPRWFVYTIYTALGIVMLVTCTLMGVLP